MNRERRAASITAEAAVADILDFVYNDGDSDEEGDGDDLDNLNGNNEDNGK